jgi:hypothetical protein
MNGRPQDQGAAAGGVVVARVRRVVTGHSERSLIHAVDPDSLEYKIEVPSDVLHNLVPGQEHSLTLSWTLQPVTAPATSSVGTSSVATAAPTPAGVPTPLPSAVDEEFMALMARPRGSPPSGQPAAGSSPPPLSNGAPVTSAAEQLAQRLGIRPNRTTG